MSKFKGFSRPQSNFFCLPNEWIDLSNEMSLSEMKVVLYILRHTWGFNEYDKSKKITIDEFVDGRKRKDGTRIDSGCGLSRRSVITGIQEAVKNGYISVIRDDRDKARVKCYYRITMLDEVNDDVQNLHAEKTDVQNLHAEVQEVNDDVQNLHANSAKNARRTEKYTTSKTTIRTTLKRKTSLRRSAACDNSHSLKGFNFNDNNQQKKEKCGCQIAAEKLYDALLVKGLVNKNRSQVSKWTKTIRDFLKQNDHISKREFQQVLIWYIKNIGGEFIPEAFSSRGFCEKFGQMKTAKLRQERFNQHQEEMGINSDSLQKYLESLSNGQ